MAMIKFINLKILSCRVFLMYISSMKKTNINRIVNGFLTKFAIYSLVMIDKALPLQRL